jgi:uncharacterized phiE125 gp8 family phage protein
MTTYLYPTSSRPWDDGIQVRLQQSADEGPDFTLDPLTMELVRDFHLRSPNGDIEDQYVDRLIRTSVRTAESFLQGRLLIPQTWRMMLTGFPWDYIELPFAPVISVDSIGYVDGSGDDQVLVGSPAEFDLDAESGPRAGRAKLRPLYGASWPSARTQHNGVVITFTAGYEESNGKATIPEDIDAGRLMVIGELYKQRSESVHAFNQNPAMRSVRSLWAPYRMY